MDNAFFAWATDGLFGNAWWLVLGAFLVMAHLTLMSVTIYLHRCQAHRAVDLHPLISHPMRFWLWFTTAMVTEDWVAIHRKHHARCETAEDPHSPQVLGINKVLFHGVTLYQSARKDRTIHAQFGHGTPTDWVERNVYARFPGLGPSLLLFLNIGVFGVIGITVWALQMLVIPVLAAGVINGLGHWWGYRNFETDDRATNISPWGLIIAGEELHNNHHAFPSSARFALRRFEFDIGWVALRMLSALGLAKILRVAPKLDIRPNIQMPDTDTVRAVLAHRFQVMTDYFRIVVAPHLKADMAGAQANLKALPGRLRRALKDHGRWLKPEQQEKLDRWIAEHPQLAAVYDYRRRLRAVFERTGQGSEATLEALRQWCHEAEQSGNAALQQFAQRLKGYSLQPVRA
ncbi:DesA family fatty acid desaturase [Aquimonas voraii]|uniref:Stearoyl-CoA desaturase (Delta-9 desaturase) n=1 Tax=Aquimonas voraii TaxID=265719 RepID=A0A1G6VCW6_9GAMM|nr:fatty acid desaturase [Aquimonas voraii]SDD51489.1 stearoyl-CoA desaturase (delta-9 desaturase) [Aquimonas voraii]